MFVFVYLFDSLGVSCGDGLGTVWGPAWEPAPASSLSSFVRSCVRSPSPAPSSFVRSFVRSHWPRSQFVPSLCRSSDVFICHQISCFCIFAFVYLFDSLLPVWGLSRDRLGTVRGPALRPASSFFVRPLQSGAIWCNLVQSGASWCNLLIVHRFYNIFQCFFFDFSLLCIGFHQFSYDFLCCFIDFHGLGWAGSRILEVWVGFFQYNSLN